MVDEAQRSGGSAAAAWAQVVRARLYGRLLFLLSVGLVFMTLAGMQLVDAWIDILAFAVVLVLAAIVPETGESQAGVSTAGSSSDPAFADAVRLFADALPEPCIVLDRRSTVVHLNADARQQFPGVVLGSPLAFTLRFPGLLAAIEAVRGSNASESIELHQTVPTDTWYKVTVAPLAPGDPVNDGVLVITMQNLTEGKRLESLRSDFIANASHELRTPLT
ncbi:MAG: hypothetical protein EON57_03510, partial [Alphaproteobacteria bacterium]